MSKILIVEDDPLILRLYQQAFAFERYEVSIATNGLEALERARLFKPDVILLDIMMPKMNGLETLDKLKADEQTKTIPVVILTNLADNDNVRMALEKGAVKYIIKSEHDPKEIVDMVKEILAGYTRYNTPKPAGM
jgi:CheY-like chemotaxis protein